jgi:hypothetical protein
MECRTYSCYKLSLMSIVVPLGVSEAVVNTIEDL